jgi:hypothetical protein
VVARRSLKTDSPKGLFSFGGARTTGPYIGAKSGLMRRKCVGLLNHLIGNGDQGWRDFKAEHLRSL